MPRGAEENIGVFVVFFLEDVLFLSQSAGLGGNFPVLIAPCSAEESLDVFVGVFWPTPLFP